MDTKDLTPQIANCGHLFHGGCIEAWFKRCGEQKCPICDRFANPRRAFLEVEGPVQTVASRSEQLAAELDEEKKQTGIARFERDQVARENAELRATIAKLTVENNQLQVAKEELTTETRNLRTLFLDLATENVELDVTNSKLNEKIRQIEAGNPEGPNGASEDISAEEWSVQHVDISEDV